MEGQVLTVTVVIPAFNAASTIHACLDALRHQTHYPDEIIVVDDGSTDDTAHIASHFGAKVVSQENRGPAAARNTGVSNANGEIVLFTDADCAPSIDWVECMIRPFEDVGISGAKGVYRTQTRNMVGRFVQQEYESKYFRLKHQQYIDFIDTYSAAYRRSVLLENNGFDEYFRLPSVEDQELSFRLARKGYRFVMASDAAVYHAHDQSLSEYIHRKFAIGYWKAIMLRWLPEKTLSDSHTSSEQRPQIILFGLAVISMVMGMVWSISYVLAILFLTILVTLSVRLYRQIVMSDRKVILLAPWLVIVRSAALAVGLVAGVFLPPASTKHPVQGLTLANRFAKRFIDVIGASIAGLLSLPILAIAAIVVKLSDHGPAIYSQLRVGENGKVFQMYKLRTMIENADHLSIPDRELLPETDVGVKARYDPRVTKVGRILRRWSIDEIPQFLNVLGGEMSLVGPRPEEPKYVEHYDRSQQIRLIVKPGMTGPVQVAGRGDLGSRDRLRIERDYINRYSLWRDAAILFQTIFAVISGKGAY